MSRGDDQADPVEAFLSAYLDAVDQGLDPPGLDGLDEATRAGVEDALRLLPERAFVEPERPLGDRSGSKKMRSAGENAREPGGAKDSVGEDGEPELAPVGESGFAVEHGVTRPPPDVVVVGSALRQARIDAGLTTAEVARELTRRGYTTDAAGIEELEDSATYRMAPRQARLLAAVLEQPLAAIEASAEPWPPDGPSLDLLRASGADPVLLGRDVIVRTESGNHLGVVRCSGDATVLDTRTYRQAAAGMLNGPWSHLAGALLVTSQEPHEALAVDALDCVTRSHAPTGLTGFARLGAAEPIVEALASYDRAYAVSWSDPDRLGPVAAEPDAGGHDVLASRIAALAGRLDDEARRARQPGKRPGYTAAATWLRGVEPRAMVALLDELADASVPAARERLDDLLHGSTTEAKQ